MFGYGQQYMPPMVTQPRPTAYQQPMYPTPTQQMVKGRVVTGIDEAKAALIDLDGSMTYFPSPSENAIYVKSIGLDGMPIFNVYKLVENKPAPVYADATALNSLQRRVEQLEAMLRKEGSTGNVQSYDVDATIRTSPAE